jgi:NUBPL iron-transfer P-loop NTPase
MGVPFLGAIPIDPKIAEACDSGRAFVYHDATTPMAEVMRTIINPIAALYEIHVPTDTMGNRTK